MQRLLTDLPSLPETIAALQQTKLRRDQAAAAIETYNARTHPMLVALEQIYIAA